VSIVPAFISGGSNVEPEKNLLRAAHEIKREFPGAAFSHCYRNRAIGFEGDDFVNFAAMLPTTHGLQDMIERLHNIEALCGRPANAPRWEPRSMDLDVLLFGNQIGVTPQVTLPRPDLLKRAFMLGPLAEIAPRLQHPVAGLTMAELWAQFDRDAHPLLRIELDLASA